MSRHPALLLILALFTALTGAALFYHGYWGIAPAFQNLAAAQVLADLTIALSLVLRPT